MSCFLSREDVWRNIIVRAWLKNKEDAHTHTEIYILLGYVEWVGV